MQREWMVRQLSLLLSISVTQERRGHTNQEKLRAQFFHESSIENSHLAGKGDFKSSEGQLADFSLELSSATNNLLLLLPSLRLCCAITQFRALRAGQRIQRLFLFITILIIFLAGLKSSLICYHLLSLLITMALQINNVKISSSISVKTYTRALHFKWQCSHRTVNNHRIFFFISLSMDTFSFLVSLTSKRLTDCDLMVLLGYFMYIERQVKVRGRRQEKEKKKENIFLVPLSLFHG